MVSTQYRCKNEHRRSIVRQGQDGQFLLNGIDYLEVAADQTTLVVYFVHPLPGSGQDQAVPPRSTPLSPDNLLISGGSRIPTLRVESVTTYGQVLLVHVEQPGDLSTYTLQLVQSTTTSAPPSGFDPQLSQVPFSFGVESFSEFDCRAPASPPDKTLPPPVIDYLSKDYASFRRLMLDRLAVTLPQWQERSPADVGVMLVELMAYAADYLSYYQDAVATEAYLGTARRRVSVRRHARLLDYFMHDGCNARAWIVINVNKTFTLPGPNPQRQQSGAQLLTRTFNPQSLLSPSKLPAALEAGGQVFETLHDIDLDPVFNEIRFYTWDDGQCCLPAGATQATLRETPIEQKTKLHKLLHPGKVLIFEAVKHPRTGDRETADRSQRHAVHVTRVKAAIDPLHNLPIVEITWSPEDALPFDLILSGQDAQGRPIADVSVVRGNVVLADAGQTVPIEDLTQDIGWQRLRPRLTYGPLVQQGYVRDRNDQWVLFDPQASAKAALQWELRDTKPAIWVWETANPAMQWQVQRDLLNSDRFARDFVVETEDNSQAYLRFGDDVLGKRPRSGLQASYRIGQGRQGNVGADAIAHLINNNVVQELANEVDLQSTITEIYNPLPAFGGQEPESIDQVKLDAPQAFRVQQRAVTEADYAQAAQQHPEVQQAIATRRWTGSWYTIFITVDRSGGRTLDSAFKQELLDFLEGFRLAGHDIAIDAPRFIPLDIAMGVQVAADYFQSSVKRALLDTFSSNVSSTGELGFFHPDRFTFGQPIYLSQIIATAVKVAGVRSAEVTQFQRWGQQADRELEMGRITMERLEILRLDNNPNAPENGRIIFNLEGGL
ncbi:putative baseplate assembly protein [Alkalinema pantanalense CENA528]|uniref:putative baseplate assembly protein n=1 Tax=Alkalinema pantanalense TaxID=1620705 RepID=UPI003D6E219F